MTHHFLINPAAGKGRLVEALTKKVARVCEARQVSYHIHHTKRPGDATDYVRKTMKEATGEEKHRFYACGGDGTLCEVINGAPEDVRAEFSAIPIGTGNDFVRNFTPPEHFFDIEKHIDGKPLKLDLMRYNGRYSLNIINIGFDCNVAKKTSEIKRNPLVPSGLAYAAGVGITLCKPFGTSMHITLADGTIIEEKLLLTAIANGGFYGGGFHAAPRSSLTDGLLDLCVIRKLSRAKFLGLVSSYKNGTYLEKENAQKYIHYYHTPSVAFRFSSPINICIDGEIEVTDRVEIEVVPHAIAFSLPAGTTLLREICDACEDDK